MTESQKRFQPRLQEPNPPARTNLTRAGGLRFCRREFHSPGTSCGRLSRGGNGFLRERQKKILGERESPIREPSTEAIAYNK